MTTAATGAVTALVAIVNVDVVALGFTFTLVGTDRAALLLASATVTSSMIIRRHGQRDRSPSNSELPNSFWTMFAQVTLSGRSRMMCMKK